MKASFWVGAILIGSSLTSCKPLKFNQNKRDDEALPPVAERASADLDKEAAFNLIPKPDDELSEKLKKIPEAASLGLGDRGLPTGTGNAQDFYLAINKRELSKKWFLTAATKQLYPNAYASPFINLGTRVVTFETQNGKLFVFDVDDRRSASTVNSPTVVVDAYPIVPLTPKLRALGLDDNFVIFDPSAGISQHGPVADFFARISQAQIQMNTDVEYLRRYRRTADGIYYEMVFSGVSNVDLTEGGLVQGQDSHPGRVVGTLGMSLRRYEETPDFSTRDGSELDRTYFFTGADGTFGGNATRAGARGLSSNPVLKWGSIRSGMDPILVKISPQIRKTQEEFPEYDVIGAVTKGIESWNKVFGFPVFKVTVGKDSDSWAADNTNMVIWDEFGELDYAYADARINPINGEIRGANIYAGATWIYYADAIFDFLPADPALAAKTHKALPSSSKSRGLSGFRWGDLEPLFLCQKHLSPRTKSALLGAVQLKKAALKKAYASFSRKMAVEQYLANVIAHEAGHVLGLRHNFKGSLYAESETSSIMDYYDDVLSAVKPEPAAYDRDAVRFLYGLSAQPPKQAFCTDEDISTDPNCRQFDFGVDPFKSYILPNYQAFVDSYISAGDPANLLYLETWMVWGLDFLQGGSAAQQKIAWESLIAKVKAKTLATGEPAPKKELSTVAQLLTERSFLVPDPSAEFAANFVAKPRIDPSVAFTIAQDLAGLAANLDGIRTMEARRVAIDALKKMQMDAGLQAMSKLKVDLLARKASLSGAEAISEGDLIARVDKYLSPYFD